MAKGHAGNESAVLTTFNLDSQSVHEKGISMSETRETSQSDLMIVGRQQHHRPNQRYSNMRYGYEKAHSSPVNFLGEAAVFNVLDCDIDMRIFVCEHGRNATFLVPVAQTNSTVDANTRAK